MAIAKKSSEAELSFEKSLARLETIVREMESGALALEKMMKHFEEGMSLVGVCGRKLNEVEHKIEQLVKQGERTVLAPFAPGAESAEEEEPEASPKK